MHEIYCIRVFKKRVSNVVCMAWLSHVPGLLLAIEYVRPVKSQYEQVFCSWFGFKHRSSILNVRQCWGIQGTEIVHAGWRTWLKYIPYMIGILWSISTYNYNRTRHIVLSHSNVNFGTSRRIKGGQVYTCIACNKYHRIAYIYVIR